MLNGEFLNRQAAAFAQSLRTTDDSRAAQIAAGWSRTLGRAATPAEITQSEQLIATLQTEHALDEDAALQAFCLYLLNLNEFLFID